MVELEGGGELRCRIGVGMVIGAGPPHSGGPEGRDPALFL
jgi:hypothetical protein